MQIIDEGPFTVENSTVVIGSSCVYDENLNYFYNINPFDPSVEYLDDEISQNMVRVPSIKNSNIEFEFLSKPKIVGNLKGTCFPLASIHYSNYFHFLIQSLPTLFQLINRNFFQDNAIIVTGKLHENLRKALFLLIGSNRTIIELDHLCALTCEKVIIAKNSFWCNELISGVPPIGNFNVENISELKRILLSNYRIIQPGVTNGFKKIFIYRKSGWRNIDNVDELAAVAVSSGFKVIVPEEYDFYEQINLFSYADVVVGPTGAWMANLLFANQKTNVHILYPETMLNTLLWDGFSELLKINMSNHFFSISINQNARILNFQPMHCNFVVDLIEFKKILDNY